MWVARDKDGCLNLFSSKPVKEKDVDWWELADIENDEEFMELNPELFPDLRWEDEPIEVELVSKNN